MVTTVLATGWKKPRQGAWGVFPRPCTKAVARTSAHRDKCTARESPAPAALTLLTVAQPQRLLFGLSLPSDGLGKRGVTRKLRARSDGGGAKSGVRSHRVRHRSDGDHAGREIARLRPSARGGARGRAPHHGRGDDPSPVRRRPCLDRRGRVLRRPGRGARPPARRSATSRPTAKPGVKGQQESPLVAAVTWDLRRSRRQASRRGADFGHEGLPPRLGLRRPEPLDDECQEWVLRSDIRRRSSGTTRRS